jgi:hypothetical protein
MITIKTNKMKKIKLLFTTHYGRMLLGVIMAIIGGLFAQNTEDKFSIGFYTMILGISILLIYFIIMFVFGVINEIDNYNK